MAERAADAVTSDFVDPETDLNDYSNAERAAAFLSKHGYIYVTGVGWYWWDGLRWVRADDKVKNVVALEIRKLFAIASQYADEKAWMAVFRHVNIALRRERINAVVDLASSIGGMKMDPRYCDAVHDLVGVPNGILDLRSGKFSVEFEQLRDGKPFTADFITLQLAAYFDPAARCPLWRQFLEQIFAGDVDRIEYVQRVVGYALSGYTTEHALFFLHGSGANGKSVFINVLKHLFGDYSAVISGETLLARRHGQQTNDLARLRGKRLVISSELEDGDRWLESLVKSLTGGDSVAVRYLYAEFFEYVPAFKLFVVGNHRPVVRGADEGIWRRMQLIPFDVFFPPDKRDRELANKLREELSGILNWALKGFAMWRAEGLNPPSAVIDATAAYRADEDRVGQFLDERCDLQTHCSVQASALYKAYHSWADARGETPLSIMRFSARLSERGIRKAKNGFVYYHGVALRTANDCQTSPFPPDTR